MSKTIVGYHLKVDPDKLKILLLYILLAVYIWSCIFFNPIIIKNLKNCTFDESSFLALIIGLQVYIPLLLMNCTFYYIYTEIFMLSGSIYGIVSLYMIVFTVCPNYITNGCLMQNNIFTTIYSLSLLSCLPLLITVFYVLLRILYDILYYSCIYIKDIIIFKPILQSV